jgi:hypothetical protein
MGKRNKHTPLVPKMGKTKQIKLMLGGGGGVICRNMDL